jgi:predicted RNA polymerase sigma factor
VLVPDQDRRLWDRLLIRQGLAALSRAQALPEPGNYTLQAAIAAHHAGAARLPEAREAYLRAAELSDNAAQQQLLRSRAQRLRVDPG